jgi:hypothetical protein
MELTIGRDGEIIENYPQKDIENQDLIKDDSGDNVVI